MVEGSPSRPSIPPPSLGKRPGNEVASIPALALPRFTPGAGGGGGGSRSLAQEPRYKIFR